MTLPVHRLAAAALGLCLAGAAADAHARSPSASEVQLAKDLATDAFAEQKAGRYADAIDMLKQVVAIKPSADVLLHLGECLAATGALREALAALEQAEDLARGGRDKATQAALLTVLADVRARLPVVSIEVPADASGVAVTIDGEPLAADALARPVPLDAGAHVIKATATGQPPFERRLTLAEREVVAVTVVFAGDEGPAVRASSSRVPMATWVAGGAALTLAAGGAVSFVVAGNVADDGERTCATQPTCDAGSQTTVRSLDAAALGLWIGAAAFAAVGVTLWVLEGDGGATAASGARASVSLRPGSAVLAGTF